MKVTGHKTRAVFDRYHIVSPSDLQEAARQLDAVRAESPGPVVTQAVIPTGDARKPRLATR